MSTKDEIPFEDRVFKSDEAAALLKIHPNTLRKWLKEGKVQGSRLGIDWRLTGKDIRAFLESTRFTPGGQG